VRVAAVFLGLALFGGLIVLAVAGVTGATAILVTAGAVVAMIGLGNAVGGRHTPDRSPYPPATDAAEDAEDAEDAEH
jgi:sugar phosphate permease